jgi:hypothetical protein
VSGLEETVLEYLDGRLTGPQLERWLVKTGTLQKLFGEDGYSKLLTLDGLTQGETIWARLREELGDRFPAEAVRERALRVCEGLLDGSVEPIGGVRRMWILRQGEIEAWAKLDRALASVPSPSQYALWEPAALAEKLEKLEAQRDAVRALAQATATQLRRR